MIQYVQSESALASCQLTAVLHGAGTAARMLKPGSAKPVGLDSPQWSTWALRPIPR